jgi:hypothetical protein
VRLPRDGLAFCNTCWAVIILMYLPPADPASERL